ncbi:hypothetical protein [Bacillus sp. NPDC060175]|uniref:hypothetical protein n=1 Tax=Bacillus sp. NPDC060175 TaxID=3347061 RepID=UPI00365A1B5D
MALERWLTDEEYARAKANGISRQLLYNRVFVLGWDIEIAMTATPGSVRHKLVDKVHEKWLRIAVENGIKKIHFTVGCILDGDIKMQQLSKLIRRGKRKKSGVRLRKRTGFLIRRLHQD